MSFLKDHPFAVEALFEKSIVLTFAVSKERLQEIIPEPLTLDLFDNKWGFVAVAMVQTKGLRPKGFPSFLGNDFFLIGYRIFVRYTNKAGKQLRGLYILKSETDKKKMEILGNIFTHYNYTTTDIDLKQNDNITLIKSVKSRLNIEFKKGDEEVSLPTDSPFENWKEARRFAGPLPFTFTYSSKTKKMLIIEGVRANWIPRPIDVINYEIHFLKTLNLGTILLANAFIIEGIPYHWKKGKKEIWE